MYGVILWSDEADRKAVIWCEDQGSLAFYSATDSGSSEADQDDVASFNAGDLVQFDLREERHLRFARNPRLVVQDYHQNLAEDLVAQARPAAPRRQSGTVVSLDDVRRHRTAVSRCA